MKKLHLNDVYSIFSKVKGTPKYWQVARNDLVAKVKQLGPFHIFYTFSCGEMRWTEVFLSLLMRKGYKVDIPEEWNGNEADLKVEGIELWKYVNEKMSESKHELFKDYIFIITRLFDARVKSFIKNILMGGGKDKISFKYYSYRVEFQARGMPHIHGVAWISPEWLKKRGIDGLDISDMDETKLIELVDELISCQLPEDDTDESKCLNDIVSSVQKHHHTKSCLKYNGKCRYGFPKLPTDKTILAKPLPSTMNEEERKKLLAEAKVTLNKAIELIESDKLDEEMCIDDFVNKLDIPGLTLQKYRQHIGITERGKTLILKRTLKERFVNNYNKEMIIAWNANMDIQLAIDPYAVITYIVNYMNKDESGLTQFMRDALTKVPTHDAKEKLRTLKTAYLTHRQIGTSEAVYRVFKGMKLKDSNITCIFVSSGFPDNRSNLFRKVSDEQDDDLVTHSNDDKCEEEEDDEKNQFSSIEPPVTIQGRAGKFQRATTVIERYAARPKYLKHMCLAQFAISYTFKAKPPQTVVFDKYGVSKLKSPNQKIFNHEILLPKNILLEGGLGHMYLRLQPRVLRIHTSKNKENHEKYYSEMLLFSHWKHEGKDLPLEEEACIAEFAKRQKEIEANRRSIYPGEEILDLLEGEDLEAIKPTHLMETLDGQGTQENADDNAEGVLDDPEFESFAYTGNLNTGGQEQFEDFKYKKICLPSNFELDHMTRQLVPEQMNIMRTVIKYCKDIVKSKKNPGLEQKPCRLIVHGGAGVGKSQTIKAISMQAEKLLRKAGHHPNHPIVLLSAFTGKAASLIGKLK